MAIFLNLNQLFNSSKIKISPLPFPLLSTIIFLVHPPPLSIPSFTSPLPFLLSSFLPPSPFFKICESYPPFQRYLFITFSLSLQFIFHFPTSLLLHTHEYEKEYLPSIWKMDKSCAQDRCGKK